MKTLEKYKSVFWLAAMITIGSLFLFACGNETTDEDVDPTIISDADVAYLSLSISQTSVKTDNSDFAYVTATLLDSDRVPVPDVSILFTTSGGQISSSNQYTDENGQAIITFRAGSVNQANQTVTVEATAVGLSAQQVPILVTGTTIGLESLGNNLEVGSDVEGAELDELTITVYNAGSQVIFDAPVTISASGPITISATTGDTDVNGQVKITVTGTGVGKGKVTITSMGATAEQNYTVGATGELFGITVPSTDIITLSTDTQTAISVLAPGATKVTFATTMGNFSRQLVDDIDDVEELGQKFDIRPDENDVATIYYNSEEAGTANIQVYDTKVPSTKDSVMIVVSAPSSQAAQISLQSSATVVAPSTTDSSHSVQLQAKVLNLNDQVVGNAPVYFSIQNPTGGGEKISPVVVYTDSSGEASTTFTSGTLSTSGEGVTCTAEILVGVSPLPENVDPLKTQDSTKIIIGGTASSIGIGYSTKISSINDDTAYELPMSVIVADSNGNPVPNTIVTLNLWPTHYQCGSWIEVNSKWELSHRGDLYLSAVTQDKYSNHDGGACDDTPDDDGIFDVCFSREEFINDDNEIMVPLKNEDTNRNLILDPGEDIYWENIDENDDVTVYSSQGGDGILTPPLSAAGTAPDTVTTDENGIATFNLYYLKAYATWIRTEVTATAIVYGTETTGKIGFWLAWEESDEGDLPLKSPFNTSFSSLQERDKFYLKATGNWDQTMEAVFNINWGIE